VTGSLKEAAHSPADLLGTLMTESAARRDAEVGDLHAGLWAESGPETTM
jgi:hypothetical protein